jgi:hypothetical protein
MIKDLQLTLYEFFGYVFPGLPMIAALGLLFWTFWFPQVALPIVLPPVVVWVIILILAYLSGHIAQAAGNALLKAIHYSPETDPLAAPPQLLSAAAIAARRALGVESVDLSTGQLYGVCSEVLSQNAHGTSLSEVFLYREGFYRGLSVSLSALTIAVLLRGVSPASLVIMGTMVTLQWTHLLMPSVFLAAGAYLMYQRYKRFARYRLSQAIIGFLLLQQADGEKRGATALE